MTFFAHRSKRPVLAALGIRWLVLVVIAFGMVISSLGMTSSHGLAVIASSIEHNAPAFENSHGHVYIDQGAELTTTDDDVEGEHHRHGLDHSHDTAHNLPFAWRLVSTQLPSWDVIVRPWIETGRAFRLDRPPID